MYVVVTSPADEIKARPIVVHSHVRWDSGWQRPRQLFSRFARIRDVVYVEEPQFLDDVRRPTLEHTEPNPHLHRVIPRLPTGYRDGLTTAQVAVRSMLLELIGATGALAHRVEAPVHWFCTPLPAPVMLGTFNESAVVYECVDALAPFPCLRWDLIARERYLLARTDVVFVTGSTRAHATSRGRGLVHDMSRAIDTKRSAMATEHERASAWDDLVADMTRHIEHAIARRQPPRPVV